MLTARKEMIRISRRLHDPEAAERAEKANGGEVVVTATAQRKIAARAASIGSAMIVQIEERCRKVLRNAADAPPDAYDQALVQRQLLATVAKAITEPNMETFAERNPRWRTVQTKSGPQKRRPIKVRDQAQYDRWQAQKGLAKLEKKLLQDAQRERKLLKMTPEERKAEKGRRDALAQYQKGERRDPPNVLERKATGEVIRTEDNRALNAGILDYAASNPDVVMLQFTTKRDGKVCDTCDAYDLWVIAKDDPAEYMYSPPLHGWCRCRWMVVTKEASKKWDIRKTPKKDWPTEDHWPAEGYGGF